MMLAFVLALIMLAGAQTMPALAEATAAQTYDLHFDNTAWQFNADDQVYWQVGVVYCATPAAATRYESLGIFVPAAYMSAVDNGDGTYTCTLNSGGSVNGYTAETAPVVIPVNTPGYSAMEAPTGYVNGVSSYTQAGFVYVGAGARGRANGYDESGNLVYDGGSPWGVTDLKAAIRYLRYNASALPGDSERIFSFGMSGGGAQSALVGATGDSDLYTPYLESIGAAMADEAGNALSDAVMGSMCWCPITSLDTADEAYEWNMGQFATTGTRAAGTFTKALSGDLASAYAEYLNKLGLTDESGNALTLEQSESGTYLSGSYYEYLMGVVQTSLNNFLSDTTFPYTSGGGMGGPGGFPGGDGQMPPMNGGQMPGGDAPNGVAPSADANTAASDANAAPAASDAAATDANAAPAASDANAVAAPVASADAAASDASTTPAADAASAATGADGGPTQGGDGQFPGGNGGPQMGRQESVTYETVQDYIDSLNEDGAWVTYDAASNTATISSLADFVTHMKSASKDVGAFDALDRSQAENDVFGTGAADKLHFDAIMASLLASNQAGYAALSDWDASYVSAYSDDLKSLDSLGNSIEYRLNMYNPMYYLSGYYEGNGSSTVAPYWRIRTGIEQGDTALTVETNLALALGANANVRDVDFETVWGQGHTQAERSGDSTANFIAWVNDCCAR
jgi:hypothetical protein